MRLGLSALLFVAALGACGSSAPAVSPTQGAFAGGTPLRIVGEGFATRGPLVAYVCQRSAKALVVESDRLIRLKTPPADAAGPCDIRLRFVDGEEIVLSEAFSYDEPTGNEPVDMFEKISRSRAEAEAE
ncbi:MAG: IPT/TIG domain-containing protein [Myxococcales bacterium]|nr:IPT/TIG domain-containing protein [Myxococcales bacterium]